MGRVGKMTGHIPEMLPPNFFGLGAGLSPGRSEKTGAALRRVGRCFAIPTCPQGDMDTRLRRCMTPHLGVRALHRAAAAGILLPDYATGSGGRVGAVVIFDENETMPAFCRVDGVAGTVGDYDIDFGGARIDDVIAPAENVDSVTVAVVSRNHYRSATADVLIVEASGVVQLRVRNASELVRTGLGDGEHVDGGVPCRSRVQLNKYPISAIKANTVFKNVTLRLSPYHGVGIKHKFRHLRYCRRCHCRRRQCGG